VIRQAAIGAVASSGRTVRGDAFSRPVRAIPCAVVLLLAATVGCSKSDITVRYAAGFDPGRHKVSVFGVYKDGLMNSEAWGGIAGRISNALGQSVCVAGYGGAAFPADRGITAAIDEYTSSNGPTDDFLAQIAPAAAGDLVMVVTVAGRLPIPIKIHVQDQQQNSTGPSGGRGPIRGQHKDKNIDLNELQLTAQLFSVAESKTVALVNIDYTGQSMDEALDKFAAQVGESLSGSRCAGWNLDAKLDVDKIRSLGQ